MYNVHIVSDMRAGGVVIHKVTMVCGYIPYDIVREHIRTCIYAYCVLYVECYKLYYVRL